MSRRDYTRFSNKEKINNDVIQNGVVNATTTEEAVQLTVDEVEVIPEPESIEEIIKTEVVGVVVDCLKLNVRENPTTDSEVVCEIPAASEVTIDEDNSTNDFYKICTAAGAEGFCMKKFIQIK